MFMRRIKKLSKSVLGCFLGGLAVMVIIRHLQLQTSFSDYDAVLEENAESARKFDQTLVVYVQDDLLYETDTDDTTRSITQMYLQKPSNSGNQNLDHTDHMEGLKEWNPYISVDSFTGNHSKDDTVKFNIVHWISVWTNCADYFSASVKQRMVYPYYHGNCNQDTKAPAISLATQMDTSSTYWEKLEQTAQNWNGPVSVALYATLDDLSQMTELKKLLEEQFTKFNLHKYLVCVHLLLERKQETENFLYPINSLRNVAVKYTHTKYVFYTEADFIPMSGLAEYAYHTAMSLNVSKLALVVPAFKSPKQLENFPQNKMELLTQWKQNITVPWYQDRDWKDGHFPTLYSRLPTSTEPYQVNYTFNYEPYYIIEKEGSPYYPEEVMYGTQDKIVHAALMNQSGYQFIVMPNAFIIHTPHEKTSHSTLSQNQVRCAHTAVHNLLRKIRNLTRKMLRTYMKTNIKQQERQMLQSQIKVRLREPNKKDLILPEEMKNSSIHIKHVHSTYQKYKKLQSQRQKAQMHRSIHNNKVSTRWGDQPETRSNSDIQQRKIDEIHWWAFA